MSGKIGDLTPKQEAALKQFKENIKDIMQPGFDDHYLLRWLRARYFDLKKSEKMLRESLEWRKKFGTDTILEWTPPEVIKKYYPGGFFGHDKEGNPIWIDTLGYIDLKGMFHSVTKKEVLKYKIWGMEHLYQRLFPEMTKKFGKKVDQCNMLFDMSEIGMKHLWKPAIDVFNQMLALFEANYPETLKVCWVINAPAIFPIAYNLAKPFLSDDTKKKIQVLGSNWKSVLLKEIDADQLPKRWGGSLTDPDGDEACRSRVCMGGVIPKSYYRTKPDDIDMSNFTVATVNRGGELQHTIEVDENECIINWQFWTDGMDIGFGLYKKGASDKLQEVVPLERVNSHVIPENGSFKCEQKGSYVLKFDNTYSWMHSKKVSFQVEVLRPDHSNELVTVM